MMKYRRNSRKWGRKANPTVGEPKGFPIQSRDFEFLGDAENANICMAFHHEINERFIE